LVVLAFGTPVLDPTGKPAPRLRARGVREAFESRLLEGGLQHKVDLDDRGMFPGTLAP
jgi:hypothetical protein